MTSARIILDTNVLISRLLLPESVAARAVRRVLDRMAPLVSEATLGELADTLSKPKFDRYVSIEDRRRFFELFARVAEWVTVTRTLRVCRDARDNKFLELAMDGEATLLVTGDKDLLALAPFRNTQILTPAELLELPDESLR
jgi:putative PIN family toxin of toxin-antitoxin system